VAARSSARMVLHRSNTGIVGSNPAPYLNGFVISEVNSKSDQAKCLIHVTCSSFWYLLCTCWRM